MKTLYFEHDEGHVQSAPEGSTLAKVLASEEAWTKVKGTARSGKSTSSAKSDGDGDGDSGGTGDTEDLGDLHRDELNRLAEEKGVESPADLPNKEAVIEAIKATTA